LGKTGAPQLSVILALPALIAFIYFAQI